MATDDSETAVGAEIPWPQQFQVLPRDVAGNAVRRYTRALSMIPEG